jgi:hypothetical protein
MSKNPRQDGEADDEQQRIEKAVDTFFAEYHATLARLAGRIDATQHLLIFLAQKFNMDVSEVQAKLKALAVC